jgi:hypothetical protein
MAMRTATLPLADDVATAIEDAMQRSGRSFEETVNESLRTGLGLRRESPQPFKVRARALNARPGFNFDKVAELLDKLEGPGHR